MSGQAWYFGVVRQGGAYSIVASGPTEGKVRRALQRYSEPTMVVTREDLPSLGVSEPQWRGWLPEASGAPPA